MAEPRIFFYNPANPGNMTQFFTLTFTAVPQLTNGGSGGAIKAGEDSAYWDVAIWNDPYGPAGASVIQPQDGASNNLAWGSAGDSISPATDVDITARDASGTTATGDVAAGKWLQVTFVTVGGTDNLYGGTYLPIGANLDTTTAAARVGVINPNHYFQVRFKLSPPGNASPGTKNFSIRVSYSFT